MVGGGTSLQGSEVRTHRQSTGSGTNQALKEHQCPPLTFSSLISQPLPATDGAESWEGRGPRRLGVPCTCYLLSPPHLPKANKNDTIAG